MQALNRIVRDVLVVAAVGATASVQADSLLDIASFEDLASATLEEYMPWGALGGEVVADRGGEPVMDPLDPDAGAAAAEDLAADTGLPDPTSCALLLGVLATGALWRRRAQRRRHAGGIGAYLA